MTRNSLGTKTLKMSQEDIEWWNDTFSVSNANSQGDFAHKLLERYNTEEQTAPEPEVITVFADKELQENEIILSLTPAQLYALRGTVTSFPDYAERQNEIIDSLKGNAPFLYSGHLFDPEFKNIFVRNIPIKKDMPEADKQNAIKHNMTAFLINAFLVNFIDGKIKETRFTVHNLKAFIASQAPKKEIAPNQPIATPTI